ncbi:MAG: VOC family protein [Ignavibacteriales bacterium]|nr:VOC family protein [Ignavibacteriales bacterium]
MRKIATIGWMMMAGVSLLFAQAVERPQILGVAHISLKVSDLARARSYYTGILGLQEAFSFSNPDGSIAVVNFKINDRQYVELTPTLKPGEVDRLNHICFETNDIGQMRQYLASKMVPVPDKLTTGRDKNLHFMVKDPDSHNVEFVQFLPDGKHSAWRGKPLSDRRVSDRMTHVGFTVKNAGAADAFYKDVLGFSEIWHGGGTENAPNWYNMRLPESTDYIEYMMQYQDVTPKALHSAHHFCLRTDDIQKTLETIRDRSPHQTAPLPVIGRNNKWILNSYDPDSTRVELMEPHTMR